MYMYTTLNCIADDTHAPLGSNFYFKQNPSDAHMSAEDMESMLKDPAKASDLMARVRRSTSKVQGSPAFWTGKRNELFALVEQKGDPTIFFTFSIADNHFPELHERLLPHAGPNTSSAERARLAISNSAVVDEYCFHRCKDMVQQFVQKTLGSEYDYTRVEYQSRGVLHVHGCAKLSTDPGCKELAQQIVKGHAAEMTLIAADEGSISDKVMAKINADMTAGDKATLSLVFYHDWLISAMNPHPHPTPPGSTIHCIPAHSRYQRPASYPWHPSNVRYADVPEADREVDREVMFNTFCRHTRHGLLSHRNHFLLH